MTFEPERPEEARGDQFETATPVRVEDIVVEKEEETEESATPFDYSVIEVHTEETPTEETSDAVTHTPDTYPDEVTDTVPYVFTDFDRVTTQEPDDQTITTPPYTPHVSSPAPTTPSGPVLPGVSQPVSAAVSVYEDMEGSASVGTDVAMQEGSADDVSPTPASDIQLGVMTDETEIGGTEPPTFVPDTESRETTTQTQTEDFEGSASGEDEASGQEPPETPGLTSTVQPIHSTLHTQPPQPAAGTEVTEVPVVLPAVETAAETGSGAEQPSGEGEASGEAGDVVDLSGEVAVTVLPSVAAVGEHTTLTTHTTSEPRTPTPSTHPFLAATDDKKHPAVTTRPAPTTPDDHTPRSTESYREQTERPTTSSTKYVSQSVLSTTSPLYTFDQSTHSVPQWALSPDPAATPLPDDEFVDYDKEIAPSLVKVPDETVATEQPETGTDSAYSVEASTVNIRGT